MMQSRGLRIQKMYRTSGNILTIQGKVSVVSGIFHPLCSARLVSTLCRYDRISGSNSLGMGIEWRSLKSHSSPPSQRTCLAMRRDASYIACGGSRSPEAFNGSPIHTPLAESVCDMARVPE